LVCWLNVLTIEVSLNNEYSTFNFYIYRKVVDLPIYWLLFLFHSPNKCCGQLSPLKVLLSSIIRILISHYFIRVYRILSEMWFHPMAYNYLLLVKFNCCCFQKVFFKRDPQLIWSEASNLEIFWVILSFFHMWSILKLIYLEIWSSPSRGPCLLR
jgi:hypothetical protein